MLREPAKPYPFAHHAHLEADRPLTVMAKDYQTGADIPEHEHGRAQLLYALSGVMRVSVAGGAWVVPPQRALWIPPGWRHAVQSSGPLIMRTAYVAPAAIPAAMQGVKLVMVSNLLRELLRSAAELPLDYDPTGRGGWLAALILDEVTHLPQLGQTLPLPDEPRLALVCRSLQTDPGRTDTLEDWAALAGTSPRSLARLFLRHTGMSFAAWRQQARMAEALARLGQGERIADIAHRLGYGSTSAFSAMMRRTFGCAPSAVLTHPTADGS